MLSACTIVARNYLSFANVLADSFFAHHVDGSFTVLVIDDEDALLMPEGGPIDWRRLGDIGLDAREIHRLAGIYDVTELATSVKPLLLRRLLDEGRDHVVYLDPDIRIFDSLEEVAALSRQHGIVLTPHTVTPYPRDGKGIDGFFVLAAGVYNLGFIGLGPAAGPFLDWWWELTRREALVDVARMMFTDQRWVDFVPCFFSPLILKDPTYNVAYWNLHGRDLTFEDGRYLVDGRPLRFFHFSGFDPQRPWILSRHQGSNPRVLLSDRPALARVCGEYVASLHDAGLASLANLEYRWSATSSGLPISSRIRRLYRDGLVAAELNGTPEPPDPFDDVDPRAFIDWLNSAPEGGPRSVSRYLTTIWQERPDLQIHFPDLHGRDAPRFAEWMWVDGAAQEKVPACLLPVRHPVNGHHSVPACDEGPEPLAAGINVAGYFRAELGIGEAGRRLAQAVEAAGIPHATMNYGLTFSRQDEPFDGRPNGFGAYDINVLCVNADATPRFARDVDPALLSRRHNVGYWFWEVEDFPPTQHAAFDVVDEVWAASEFVADAIRAAGRRPVFTVPLPIPVPFCSPTITRESLGLPDQFTFLFAFDFLSLIERKHPIGLIQAFSKAFAPNEGPVLVLKSINGSLRVNDFEQVRTCAAGRPDIVIRDEYQPAAVKNALIGLVDCYVSLHRSEGLGLTMAEAMALGKPVIATGYSGNLQFMTPENSYLVDYAMTAVPPGCDPYPVGAGWAEPNLDQAAGFMREVYDRPDLAAARGQRGRADILAHHHVNASAAIIARRCDEIRLERRSRLVVPTPRLSEAAPAPSSNLVPVAVDQAEMTALLEAVSVRADRSSADPLPLGAIPRGRMTPAIGQPVRSRAIDTLEQMFRQLAGQVEPRLSVEGRRFPRLRRAAQRGLFRLTRPHWIQMRAFHTDLLGAFQQVVGQLHEHEAGRAELDRRLDDLAQSGASAMRDLAQSIVASTRDLARFGEAVRVALERQTSTLEANTERLGHAAAGIRGDLSYLYRHTQHQDTKTLVRDGRIARVESLTRGLQHTVDTTRTMAVLQARRSSQLEAEVSTLRSTVGRLQDEASVHLAQLAALASQVDPLRATLDALVTTASRTAALESAHASLQEASATFVTNASAHLKGLTSVVAETETRLSTLTARLFAVPYMSDPGRFLETDTEGRTFLGYASSVRCDPFYLGFEDIFRGPEALVRDRQRAYLPLLRGRARVADIGCGRGEFLDLLVEAGLPAVGVDIDAAMIAHCRAKGRTVVALDAVEFLRGQPPGSMPAIFTAQMIEHLAFEDLREFLVLCRSRLEPGGLLIAETVNPHSLEAFKTFYTDLSHRRPIFPEVALALCQLVGFEQARVVFPAASGDLDRDRQSHGEYAVVASPARAV